MKIEGDLFYQIEISVNKSQHKEYRKIGDYQPKIDGYVIFEYNKESGDLSPASFRQNTTYEIGGKNRRVLDVNPGCVYIEALNERNAIKRLARGDVIHIS